jgi:hypothetical protein
MKKVLFVLVLSLFMSSCSDDVVFNNPSVQGLMNNVFWRALQSKATLSKDGTIAIEAVTLKETLTLHLSSTQVKTYVLDNNTIDYVSYTSRETTPTTILSTRYGKGTGKITITEYDVIKNTISGTFTFVIPFIATDTQESKEFYFSQGVFYKVPVAPEVVTLIK